MSLDDARIAQFMGSRGTVTVKEPAARAWNGVKEPDVFAEPPPLGEGRDIGLDFETNGTDWRRGHRPGGAALRRSDGTCFYLAWGHRGGGNNISRENAVAYLRESLKDRRITNHTTGFEVHMSRELGVDLEELGCEVSDVAHWAAHVDDQRKRFSLEELCLAYLPEDERKVKIVDGVILDPSRMMDYPASLVGVRAIADVRQVGKLMPILWKMMDDMGLQRVRALEDEVIFAATEMEKNAAPLDIEKLGRWVRESEEELDAIKKEVAIEIGRGFQETLFDGGRSDVSFLNPDSRNDMAKLFNKLGLEMEYTAPSAANPNGLPSFTAEILSRYAHVPVIGKIIRQGKLLDLRSKFLLPYWESAKDDGLLKFRLHQCRYSDDAKGEGGTKRGRFSSSDVNIQQVLKTKKQKKAYGDRYIVRELFVGGEDGHGQRYAIVEADARQIEYRIFASYEGSPKTIQAYKDNPLLDFHDFTTEEIKVYKPELDRDGGKTCNFLTVYGGGLPKLALALGFISAGQFRALNKEFENERWGVPRTHPLLARALEVKKIYDRVLPGVRPLAKEASKLALERGYVKDILGRRATFPGGFGTHAALNAVIQPSAAEIMKMKLVEVHRVRKAIGFVPRMTIHDSIFGDRLYKETSRFLAEILDRQSIKLKVPILWDVNIGGNWGETVSAAREADDPYVAKFNDGTRFRILELPT